ncbi:FUSC family protein [Actinocatenispora rupis]|uniref:FUSC family protein n=1 Tax=Actinocatenispora rupis TaxID=519421 RepID=A0A8J3JCF8_9ACTN|nr:FUSC family protein [Actinocatenispora rupis]GID15887.1 FUSC family protein [Actinocatenispora rupis]
MVVVSATGSPRAQRWTDLVAAGYDRIVASDPGLARLRLALGVLASVALAATVLALTGFAPTAVLLGASIAMIASSGPVLPTPRKQAAVVALTIVPAVVSLTVSALLSPYRIVADLVFLVVIFVAVYIRRIPDYGFPLGFPAFMMFFFASFVHATVAQLPMLVLAVAIGLVCCALVRLGLLRPRSTHTYGRVRRGFQARLAQVLDGVVDLLDEPDPRRADRLRRRVARMHESALMVEAELDSPLAPPYAGTHQRRVLTAELAAERLAAEARALAADPELSIVDRRWVLGRLTPLVALVRADRRPNAPRFAVPEWAAEPTADAPPALHAILWSAADLATTIARAHEDPAPSATGDAPDEQDEDPSPRPAPPPVSGLAGRLLPSTRQAIQATLACALAILAGELLSPQRWYWAVIAAFVVFAGTSSAGETLMKGFRRVVGTLVGIVTGTLVAILVTGHLPLVVVLLFVCIFAGFYLMPISYSSMVFFITVMLGLLYSLLGTFTPTLLVLRLEETAIGAAAGALAALLVLPTSTRTALRTATADFLDQLAGFVDATADCLANGELVDLVDAARDLDAALDAVHRTAEPLLHRATPRRARRSDTRHLVSLLDRCGYHARAVAAHAEPAALPADAALVRFTGEVSGTIRALLPDATTAPPERTTVCLPATVDPDTRVVLRHLTDLDTTIRAAVPTLRPA